MEQLLEELKLFGAKNLSFEGLGEFVRRIDLDKIDHVPYLPQAEGTGYSRNVLMMEPLECVLLYWPAGSTSAIHWHKGFWGYVLVLEGECDNVEFKYADGQLIETNLIKATKGGVLNEPDGVIHKLVNDTDKPAVTLHFYYPALVDMDGMAIYNEEGTMAVLNEKALTASFDQPMECFRSYQKNDFEYVPYIERKGKRTHRIVPVIPKPKSELIQEMLGAYYSEQASVYDMFDLQDSSRKNFVERIDELIAFEWKNVIQPEKVLMIACGTGRRAEQIRAMSGIDPEITGVDMSEEMCKIARTRKVDAIASNWENVDVTDDHYDTATFLYAFGHVPNNAARQEALKKIHNKLKPDGALFFDVFNAMDINEWGPNALENYFRNHLYEFGYERGDVFYKKVGGNALAYLHYFYQDEIHKLLNEAGFRVEYIKHIGYVHRSGELLGSANEGSLFIKAIKQN